MPRAVTGRDFQKHKVGPVQDPAHLRLRELIDSLHALFNWLRPIANFTHSGLTNAATEGINNVIRYVKHISYGLPNFEHLRLRILAQAL